MKATPPRLRVEGRAVTAGFTALDGVADPVFVLAGPGGDSLVFANSALCAATGMSRERLLAAGPSAWLSPDAARRVADAARVAFERGHSECHELEPAGGVARLRRIDHAGRSDCVVTLPPRLNADELAESRAELRHRAALLTTAMDLEGMAAWTWHLKTGEIRVEYRSSDRDVPRLDSPSLEAFLAVVADEDRERVSRVVPEVLASDGVFRFEFRTRTERGGTRWLSTATRRFLDVNGKPAGLIGATRDVTVRKRVYESLAASEERLRLILEAEPECVKVVGADGQIQLMNRAGLVMLEADDEGAVLGRPVTDFVVAEYCSALVAGHERVMAGDSAVFEFEIQGLKGRRRWVESSAAPLRDSSGHIVAVLAVTRDVTEKRQLASAIIEATGREQERIGHDLHDGLGQELTGIALMLKGMQGQLDRPRTELDRDITQIVKLVNEAIQSTRALAHGLSPVAVEQGGLAAALRDLVARLRETSGVALRFTSKARPDDPLDTPVALHLYRIAQESLNNAIRHAGARRIELKLNMSVDRVELRILDDGKGLPLELSTGAGLGVRIMEHRARMIGATLRIDRRRGGGTAVIVSSPRSSTDGRAAT